MTFKYENVHFDETSRHQFKQLNESLFIEKMLDQLTTIMGSAFFNYEFYVFSHQGEGRVPASTEIKTAKRKVLLFFSDELGIDPRPYSHHYYAIFKSYIGNLSATKNVFPLPLGYVKSVPRLPLKAINERRINIFFRGNLNSNRINFYRSFSKFGHLLISKPKRGYKLYISFLLKLKKNFSSYFPNSIIIFNNGFKTGYTPAQYGEILAESKIVLCPKGFDMSESFRHFEAMRAGCIIISEKLPKTDFYSNSPIIEIDKWEEGLKIAKELISNKQKMEAIHNDTVWWWEKKCSEKGTAQYINDKLLKLEVT